VSEARVGRVRLNGGADLRVIEGGKTDKMAEIALGVARGASDWAADRDVPIVGYATVFLAKDGTVWAGASFDGEETAMNRYAFVGMVSEVVREVLVTEHCAVDVFNNQMV
jgi:hypothetical protein